MKVKFVYSKIYDNMLTEMSGKEFSDFQIEEMILYKGDLEKSWKKEEKMIVADIEKTANLKFNGDKTCFLVNNMLYTAVSNPLTLKKNSNLESAKTILVHELIHKLFEDNSRKVSELTKIIYPNESFEFRLHVPVLLIAKKVIEKNYGKNTLNKEIKNEMETEILNKVWPEVKKLSKRFDKDIIKFLKNENTD